MSKKIKNIKTAEQHRADAERLQAAIAEQVDQLRNSEQWDRFLQFACSSYSVNNLILIMIQFPTESRLAGFRQRQAKGRQVRKGEKSIKIFGYAQRKSAPTSENQSASTAMHSVTRPGGRRADHDQASLGLGADEGAEEPMVITELVAEWGASPVALGFERRGSLEGASAGNRSANSYQPREVTSSIASWSDNGRSSRSLWPGIPIYCENHTLVLFGRTKL